MNRLLTIVILRAVLVVLAAGNTLFAAEPRRLPTIDELCRAGYRAQLQSQCSTASRREQPISGPCMRCGAIRRRPEKGGGGQDASDFGGAAELPRRQNQQ